MKDPKTKRGAIRQQHALIRAYTRDYAGGGLFGWDWPTLRSNRPETYDRLRALAAIYPTLPG